MGAIVIRLFVILITSVAVTTIEPAYCAQRPKLVEVWSGGDDGYTLRLRDALERAFRGSPNFRLSSGRKPGSLIVYIPHSVKWKRVGVRTQVFYDVEFSTIHEKILEKSNGSCWEDDLGTCATSIIRSATDVAQKIH